MQQPEALTLLRQHGFRVTPQRMLVLAIISGNPRHLTAEEIHTAAIEHQPSIDIATVYRTLQWLEANRLVSTISIGEGKQRYEYCRAGEMHHHLVCRRCGSDIQIPDDYFGAFKASMEARYGFAIDVTHLALLGLCAACRAAQ